jgi:hypothetical protein
VPTSSVGGDCRLMDSDDDARDLICVIKRYLVWL